jgi:hypothetical protein
VKLFDVVPQNLFSILACKNKSLYIEALFVLRKAFRQEMTISKSDLVSMLIANLDEAMLTIDMEAEKAEFGLEDDDAAGGQSLSATAHYILRRLRDTGWIEAEYQLDSFEESITLPDYTIRLINTLYSFTDDAVREYNSFVYSTYSALRTADTDRDDFMYNALLTAYENTVKLVDELKTLHNNIRRYHQALNNYATANEVLKGHFDEYKALIMDNIYHPLKTLDSVPRFKIPILKIIEGWLSDTELKNRIAEQAVRRGKYRSLDDAMDDIVQKMIEISDLYEGMDGMLDEIDRKNAAYTRASIEKMHYMLNTDRSIKGKLVEIITAAAPGLSAASDRKPSDTMPQDNKRFTEPGFLLDMLAGGVELYKQGYVDEKSLYRRPGRSNGHKDEKPLGIEPRDADMGEAEMKEFIERTKKLYNQQKIMAFVEYLMTGRDIVNSSEIRLENDEEFILLILAALNGNESSKYYKAEFTEGYVECGGYRIPGMRFIRKGTVRDVD